MANFVWHPVGADAHIGFSFPCERVYSFSRDHSERCASPYQGHGHLMYKCADGTGRVPFCCETYKGVRGMLEFAVQQGTFSQAEADAYLDLDEVKRLPAGPTREEAAALASEERMFDETMFFLVS